MLSSYIIRSLAILLNKMPLFHFWAINQILNVCIHGGG